MTAICREHVISRAAYYKHRQKEKRRHDDPQRSEEGAIPEELLLNAITAIREQQPMLGGLKLLWKIRQVHGVLGDLIGRDRFFTFLRQHTLLIKPKKRYCVTTNSHHRFHVYDNLLLAMEVATRPNEVFVADITYLRLNDPTMTHQHFAYLALVTDLYSRKIVGYHLGLSLSIEGSLRALTMALENVADISGLLHHSDRGIQYCSGAYITALTGARISMADSGNPYQNAVAERVNGILKQEFFLGQTFPSFSLARRAVRDAIRIYNNERPHRSIGMMTPSVKYAA